MLTQFILSSQESFNQTNEKKEQSKRLKLNQVSKHGQIVLVLYRSLEHHNCLDMIEYVNRWED